MNVVSNMSPFHYLILIDCDRILPLIYEQVFTPPAAIALAREIQAGVLLIDDKKGIQEAQKRGLKTVRMLTIVDWAVERGLIDNLPDVLDSLLNSTPFYAGKEVSKVVADMKRRISSGSKSTGRITRFSERRVTGTQRVHPRGAVVE
jgi:predicted nucleic acid-binding protein